MSDTIIKLENISKQYRLGTVGTQTLRGDLQRWWYRLSGKEDPTLKIGASNKLDTQEGEYVWALKDINLEVKQGEVLGIIGKNGAGKSTLLKLLSRVTGPTTGQIKVKGRIASLLEVGTGFHPELTGRENIFLNGAILGMAKPEIRAKFDEIVDFAGVAKYIDTPVKRYSSGMYVRLAFAVAAHLEPDILVVDEVLAVGDAEFQKKAIGKMKDVSTQGGRTVLFVSHNMASVERLCTRAIVLKDGREVFNGTTVEAIDYYISNTSNILHQYDFGKRPDRHGSGEIRFSNVEIINENSTKQSYLETGKSFKFKLNYKINDINATHLKNIIVSISLKNTKNVLVFNYNTYIDNKEINLNCMSQTDSIICEISNLPVFPGEYIVNYSITQGFSYMDGFTEGFWLEVRKPQDSLFYNRPEDGSIFVNGSWSLSN